MCSLSVSLSSSAIACARFLSTLLCTLLLICHFRRRSICNFVLRGIFRPKASLPTLPIIVVRPLSCTEKDRGTPTLLLDSFSLWVNALHSGPLFIVDPVITRPQFPHIISPDSATCTMLLLPHSVHTSSFVSLSLLLDIFWLIPLFGSFFHPRMVVLCLGFSVHLEAHPLTPDLVFKVYPGNPYSL